MFKQIILITLTLWAGTTNFALGKIPAKYLEEIKSRVKNQKRIALIASSARHPKPKKPAVIILNGEAGSANGVSDNPINKTEPPFESKVNRSMLQDQAAKSTVDQSSRASSITKDLYPTLEELSEIRRQVFGEAQLNNQNSQTTSQSLPRRNSLEPMLPKDTLNAVSKYEIETKKPACKISQYANIPTNPGTYEDLWICSTKKRNEALLRNYDLIIPSNKSGTKLALLLALHGGGGSPKSMAAKTGFHEYGEEYGFVTVYPAGYANKWNSGHAGIEAHKEDINDVRFIEDLIDTLITHLSLDRNRVYIAGHSNGAMMAHRLGAELSTKITAIAPVAGTTGGSLEIGGLKIDYHIPRASEKISIFAIHGKCDSSVTYDGSKGPTTTKGRVDLPTLEGIEFWAQTNGCGNPYLSNLNKDKKLPLMTYSYGCGRNKNQKTTVKLLTIHDGGHGWPTGESGQDGKQQLRNVKKLKEAIQWGEERGCSLSDISNPSPRVNASELIINEFFKSRN